MYLISLVLSGYAAYQELRFTERCLLETLLNIIIIFKDKKHI